MKAFGVPFYLDKLGGSRKFAVECGWFSVVFQQKKTSRKAMRQEYDLLRRHLSDFFGAKVQFSCDERGKGKISIPFKNEEDLERLMALFDKLK